MAKFIPTLQESDFNNSPGEKEVYEALSRLDNNYTVFYSYQWVGKNNSKTLGEVDFILLHPDKGMFIVEVKSGAINYEYGKWYTTNRKTGETSEINPFSQARRNMYAIDEQLDIAVKNRRLSVSEKPFLYYGVWFTSVNIPKNAEFAGEANRNIILDSNDLINPEEGINKILSYWSSKDWNKGKVTSLKSSQIENIVRALCPAFHIVPTVKSVINNNELKYIQLTKQQGMLLEYLEEQSTAVIHGLAGTGKTVLGIEKAKMLADQGKNVLYLCFNKLLRDHLKNNYSIPNVVFHNVHSLAAEIVGHNDWSVDKVIEEFEEYLEDVYDESTWEYTNVIVDEGQDLDDRLLNRLYDLVKKQKGCFYVFYDRNQRVITDKLPKWIDEAECRLVLKKNCRNTAEVFRTSCSLMGLEQGTLNEVNGDKPAIKFFKSAEEQAVIIDEFIAKMNKEGIKPENIVVLTAASMENTTVDLNKKYGGFKLSNVQVPGKVFFTTIRKFKGLEADVVLIVDVSLNSMRWENYRRNLYTGTSRAKFILCIAINEDVAAADLKGLYKEMAPNHNIPSNKKGLVKMLKAKE